MTQIDSGCTTQHVLPEKSVSGSDLAKHEDVRDTEALSYAAHSAPDFQRPRLEIIIYLTYCITPLHVSFRLCRMG